MRVRASLTTMALAESLQTGKLVQSHSAIEDPRFRERVSVRQNRIQALMCVPLRRGGGTGATFGVL